ncbi:MAG: bifunctional DNA-formamidopyrimidine glycosylase/DNA-(apurinic or apyrimidinic site) lyase [Chitinophagaceae bacterium]|nr:bifunctional DNA-formamidopyrimidine glycosylase/DNA-(apurinic or apyrimidinic site) lyase [Rubrivivax sp.]
MPELPEVEVTRQGIDGPLRGARVLAVRTGKPLRWPLGCTPESLSGQSIGPVQRRGKYLWLPLNAPAPAHAPVDTQGGPAVDSGGLLMHLGMSGSLALLAEPGLPGPHDHFDLVTSRGTLRLNDPRRFGAVLWSAAVDVAPAATLLARLGAEPFDPHLTPAGFHAALRARRVPIKSLLLSGQVVVGAGNIYACEALFHAAIHPALRSDRISRPRAARLLEALRTTLARALAVGGSTLRDFSDAHGVSGAFQSEAAVYARAGSACVRCGGAVRRVLQAQRSTFFCPGCQKR